MTIYCPTLKWPQYNVPGNCFKIVKKTFYIQLLKTLCLFINID